MKYLKIKFLAISLFAAVLMLNAQKQSLTMDASQTISTFRFLDSQSNLLSSEYEGLVTGAYGIGYRYIFPFNLILKGGVGMRNGGANLVYDEMNYSWNLQYLDAKVGAGYMYPLGKFSPYVIVSGYYAHLLRGIQVLNNEEFNITESGLLNPSDIGIVVNPGVNFELSEYISTYLEFNYTLGFYNIETDITQKAQNISYGLTLGLSFTITK